MPAEPLQFDHYEVPLRADGSLWELGRGAMGITYKAFDTRLRVDVVLKIIKQELLTSERARFLFLREARAAAKVRHPNIAAVITLHDTEPFYYTMEFVAGHSLAELLKARGPLPPAEALDYADQIAAALGAMGREHIVHRDLKPANIMVVPDEDRAFENLLKVIDFGLAKGFRADDIDPETHLRSLTSWQSGFSGTVAYASPEQCAELPEIDGRSDLYAAGVILWQMLSGRLPFSGTLGQISAMHQSKEPPWEQLGQTAEPVIDLLRRLLAKDPDDRFPTARDLRDAIAATTALLVPGHAGRPTSPDAPGTGDADETQASARVPETVRLGTTIAGRFTIGDPFAEGDGGKLFKVVDNEKGTLVAMKLLDPRRAADDNFCVRIRDELNRVRRKPQSVLLAPKGSLLTSGDSTFYVREWANGFSLEDLLRARQGELRPRELWRLLHELPAALDYAATEDLTLAEPLLRKLFVCPAPGAKPDDDWASLRARPVEEWPDFRLRWNAISFRPLDDHSARATTRIHDQPVSATEDRVRALACLLREMLGGRAGTLTPLPALGDEPNAILQRALVPEGGIAAFVDARAFWDALAGRSNAAAGVAPLAGHTPDLAPADRPSLARPAAEQRKVGPVRPRFRVVLMGSLLLLGGLAAGRFWLNDQAQIERKRQELARQATVAEEKNRAAREQEAREREGELKAQLDQEKAARVAAERELSNSAKATPSPTPAASAIASATRARPFVNGLGMKFVPVPGVKGLFSIWKTRVADFQAYCEARPYWQKGGIYVQKLENSGNGGLAISPKLEPTGNWKEPGFPQSPNHPVVGVSWDESREFCEWLTFTDRKAGRIASNELYRLPTDAEWSAAVGTSKYPWGNDGPPPKGAGNYLDAERAGRLARNILPTAPGEEKFIRTSPVGTFAPNAHGLYDLGGNVWESCEDEYKSDLNDEEAKKAFPAFRTERAADGVPFRVVRGASWVDNTPILLRSAFRGYEYPTYRADNHGFRVVLVSDSR